MGKIDYIDIITVFVSFGSFAVSVIALLKSYSARKPYINLLKMYFDPKDFHIYSFEKNQGYESLERHHEELVSNTLAEGKKFSIQRINGEDYILVNSLTENYNIQDVRLILAPYQVKYKNTGYFASEIRLKAAIIKRKKRKKIVQKSINYCIMPLSHDDIFSLKVAYICKVGDYTSVIYDRLQNMSYFDYRGDKDIAKGIINFEKEIYVIECLTNSREKYRCKLIYQNTNEGLKYSIK